MSEQNTNRANSQELGFPIQIPEKRLSKLTVPEIKAELTARDVPFLSKMRKQALLDLLKSSLTFPVVSEVEVAASATKKKQRSEKKETALPWNDSHPAKSLLINELIAGNIPLNAEEMGPAEVFYTYGGTMEFQMKGMQYGPAFIRRLADLRKKMVENNSRASKDLDALKVAIRRHPPPPLNWRGQPQWNGSVAQALLQYDMSLGKHKEKKPHELRLDRIEYQAATSVDQFRWHLQQETRTKKYLYTLQYRADMKLRENLKKDGFIFDEDSDEGEE